MPLAFCRLLAVSLLAAACAPAPHGKATMRGHWVGTWTDEGGATGPVIWDLSDQPQAMVGGTAVWTGTTGTVNGSYDPNTGAFVGQSSSPQGNESFNLDVSGPSATGPYMSMTGGSAPNSQGTLTMLRMGVGNEPNSGPPPGSGGGSNGGGDCADSGQSCQSDSTVVRFTDQCGSSVSQAPCYCAAAAVYACFYRHGCYAGKSAVPTSMSKEVLTSGCQQSLSQAAQLGTSCGVSCT
jgi:hypothetical protein